MNKEYGLPIGASNVRAVYNGVEYPIDSSHIHTRTGEQGSHPVLCCFVRDTFEGEILEGGWRKWWDTGMDADQAFVAKLDTTNGELDLLGEADVAGTLGKGGVNQNNPIILIDTSEIDVAMISPIDDTGGTADRDIFQHFMLIPSSIETIPTAQTNYLMIRYNIDESGLLLEIKQNVNGTLSTIFDGSTYDDASTRATGDLEATIWRVVFHGKPGTSGAHVHIYLKQGADLATAEAATENELSTSPYDTDDWGFHVAYPTAHIESQNTSYYDDASPAVFDYIEVSYPDFQILWGGGADSRAEDGAVQLWDGNPDSGGQRVFTQDHEFTDDIYLQNGLIRIVKDDTPGIQFYCYTGAAWVDATATHKWVLNDGSKTLEYAFLKSIETDPRNPEKITIKVRFTDTTVDNSDYYLDIEYTLTRGSQRIEVNPIEVYPLSNVRLDDLAGNSPRFGYAGNDAIGDDDLNITGANTTLSDNYAVIFDNDGNGILHGYASNKQPAGINTRWRVYEGRVFYYDGISAADILDTIIFISLVPFSLNANLFKEAESATISASARLYFDGVGEDTDTENTGVWVATTNCAVIENQAGGEESVGSFCVRITSSAAGTVKATVTPTVPLGNLLKFDFFKLYLHKAAAGVPTAVTIRLYDGSGNNLYKDQAISTIATQYTINIPHSDTDLQGWTKPGASFVYSDFVAIVIEWSAAAGGEIVYVDGLHEYIGTTTTRGRGETLSGGSAVVFDAQNEEVYYQIIAGTALPAGLYLGVYRAKDTVQVASDSVKQVSNATDGGAWRNENNSREYETLTSSFAYYFVVFFISDADTSGDAIRVLTRKSTVTENTIFVDYFLIVPLSNGKDFPMDQAHAALMDATVYRRPRYRE